MRVPCYHARNCHARHYHARNYHACEVGIIMRGTTMRARWALSCEELPCVRGGHYHARSFHACEVGRILRSRPLTWVVFSRAAAASRSLASTRRLAASTSLLSPSMSACSCSSSWRSVREALHLAAALPEECERARPAAHLNGDARLPRPPRHLGGEHALLGQGSRHCCGPDENSLRALCPTGLRGDGPCDISRNACFETGVHGTSLHRQARQGKARQGKARQGLCSDV